MFVWKTIYISAEKIRGVFLMFSFGVGVRVGVLVGSVVGPVLFFSFFLLGLGGVKTANPRRVNCGLVAKSPWQTCL